jgi:hypothetical protein
MRTRPRRHLREKESIKMCTRRVTQEPLERFGFTNIQRRDRITFLNTFEQYGEKFVDLKKAHEY